jgi:hypothetical protein
MIDVLLTGMTGRINNMNRVYDTPPVKKEETSKTEPKATTQLLDNISLSSEALELYSNSKVNNANRSEKDSSDTPDKKDSGVKNTYGLPTSMPETAASQSRPSAMYGFMNYANMSAQTAGSLIDLTS